MVAGAALVGMALVQPREATAGGLRLDQLLAFGALALWWPSPPRPRTSWSTPGASRRRHDEELGLMTSPPLGYRAALLVTDALILVLARTPAGRLSYEPMALLMGVGVVPAAGARTGRRR